LAMLSTVRRTQMAIEVCFFMLNPLWFVVIGRVCLVDADHQSA